MLTAVVEQVLQLVSVGVDEVEVVLQPGHLTGVPGLLQLSQPGDLVHQLLLLTDPQRPVISFNDKKLETSSGL